MLSFCLYSIALQEPKNRKSIFCRAICRFHKDVSPTFCKLCQLYDSIYTHLPQLNDGPVGNFQ